MVRRYLLTGLFVIFLGCAGIVNGGDGDSRSRPIPGADTKVKTKTNNNDSGFSVENSSGDTIIRADGAGGFVIPRLTTDERDALTPTAIDGMMIYNTDNKWFEGFQKGTWIVIGSGAANLKKYVLKGTPCSPDNQIQDIDGNWYNTVQIGTQCWMSENLNVGAITSAIHQTNNGVIEKYCFNDDEANCITNGGLYEWDEMMNYTTDEGARGICPEGWHIPTNQEWITLERLIGIPEDELGFGTFCPANHHPTSSRSLDETCPRGVGRAPLLRIGGLTGFNAISSGIRIGTFVNPVLSEETLVYLLEESSFINSSTFGESEVLVVENGVATNARGIRPPSMGDTIERPDVRKLDAVSVRCIKD